MRTGKWVCVFRALVIVLCIACSIRVGWPQASTSAVRGTVLDQVKAAVVGASVSLANTDTNVISRTTTNQAGLYEFPGVVPGPYRLAVEAPGMQRFEGILTVQVQQDAVVDAVLKVGDVKAEVSVQDVTPMLVMDKATLGHVLEQQRIEQLPINGRYVQTLLQTVPGMEGWTAYGTRADAMEWVQDGAVFTSRYEPVIARPPGLDTIQEFNVVTNSASARYTNPTTVIISTKNGTNTLHGALFETARNNGFGVARSRTDFFTKPPHLVRNEFGASAGGPVYLPKLYNGKNRTFWFFAWEAFRNMNSTTGGYAVPTFAMRNGDFSGEVNAAGQRITLYDPLTTNAAGVRLPLTYNGRTNVIDPSRENPIAKFLLGITPTPTLPQVNPLVANNWFGPVPNPQRQETITFRIDQRFSDRDQFYGRYTNGHSYFITPIAMPTTIGVVNNYSGIGPNATGALHHVHIFSPTFFNELTVSAHRDLRGSNYDRDTPWLDQLNLPNPRNVIGFPAMGSWGSSYVFQAWTKNGSALNYLILDDDATKMRGRHELQFGFHLRYDQLNVTPNAGPLNIGWGSLATSLLDPASTRTNPQAAALTGDNLANMYLGLINYSATFVRGYYYWRNHEHALYFQDNYKVTSRLTLNLGLRWDMFPPPTEKNNILSGYDTQNHAVVLGANLNSMYQLGYTLPSIVNQLGSLGAKFESYQQAGLPQNLVFKNWKNFGPHAGFAYRASDGRRPLVLRGGYSMSYFPILMQDWSQNFRLQPPYTAAFSYNPNSASLSPDGIPNYWLRTVPTVYSGVNDRNVIDLNNASSITPGSNGMPYFNPHLPDSQTQNWNLTLEKEVMRDTVARVAYVGNHSANLDQYYTYNEAPSAYVWYTTTGQQLPTGLLANSATRPFDQQVFGSYMEYMKTGWSNYNGVQFEFERRYNRGYGFQVFYNIANAMSTDPGGMASTASTVPGVNQYLPGTVPQDYTARDRFLTYQRDPGIPKHHVRWNWIADLPFGKDKWIGRNAGGLLNKIIGGWQIAALGDLHSTYFALPTNLYPTGAPIQNYGYQYPIQDCRSGSCIPGYLWWNGYIQPNQINSHNAAGQCTGVCGVPSNYTPAGVPLIPYGSTALPPNAPAGTNVSSFWSTNTVWIPLKDGTVQRTTYGGLNPWQNQRFPSVRQWGLDASLFKSIVVRERLRVRFNADFFNVLNHPGNPSGVGDTGILSTQASGQAARQLQVTLRVTW